MTVYLDASVVVALLTKDLQSTRADLLIERVGAELLLSDLAAAEFAAVIARRVRERILTASEADQACAALDRWASRETSRLDTTSPDIRRAETFLRRRDLNLRTQDAIHIALSDRAGAGLATFDRGMATAARALGVSVLDA